MDHTEVAAGHRGAGGGEGRVEPARVSDLDLHVRVGDPAGEPGRLVAVARHRLLAEGGQARGDAQLDELGVEAGGGGDDHPVDPGR